MAELTANEGIVVQIVRRQARQGDPVSAGVIKSQARKHGVMYDSVDRALRGLLFKGLVVKPSRGFYLPASDKIDHNEEDR